MSEGNKNFKVEDAEEVATALGDYIGEVNKLATDMQKAASECHDNLADDTVSVKAISSLNRDLKAVFQAVEEAAEIRKKLLKKIEEVKIVTGTSM